MNKETNKKTNIHIIRVPEREKLKNGTKKKKYSNKMMTENSPNWEKI